MLGPTRARYDGKVAAWYEARPDLVDRAQTHRGPEFALLIDAPSGMNIITDRCGMVVKRDAPARGKDCKARLTREVKVLTARQDAVNSQKPTAPVGSDALIPGDYTTSLRIAITLLDRVTSCKRLHPGLEAPLKAQGLKRCPNLDTLQNALNLRVNLLGMRQIDIKNALPAG